MYLPSSQLTVLDLQNLSRPFVIGISIQIGGEGGGVVSNMFPPLLAKIFPSSICEPCIKVQEGMGGTWMQKFLVFLYFLCRYGNPFLKSRKVKID